MKIKPKARPRAAVQGWYTGSKKRPWAQIYMPKDYTDWQRLFTREIIDWELPEGPLGMVVICHIHMPKGWSKKRKKFMEGKPYPANRYDIDNNLGSVMDCMLPKKSGGDGRIAEAFTSKVWAYEDAIEVAVYELIEEEDYDDWIKYGGKSTGKNPASEGHDLADQQEE